MAAVAVWATPLEEADWRARGAPPRGGDLPHVGTGPAPRGSPLDPSGLATQFSGARGRQTGIFFLQEYFFGRIFPSLCIVLFFYFTFIRLLCIRNT